MLSYVIVGSGYRAEYFGRVARIYPGQFRAMYLCRSEEKAEQMKRRTGADASVSLDACLAFRPDFAVVAVDRGHVADVAEDWIAMGYPVVAETPVGDTPEKLERLWQYHKSGAKIVCCEQYHRYPILASGLNAVAEGKIGVPSSAYISLLHDYHAFSILRKALQIQPGESYTLRGERQIEPVTVTDSRYGAILDGSALQAERDIVHLTFASEKEAIYDFCPVQYRSFIRARHLTVRGDRGEWNDTLIMGLDEQNRPRRTFLLPEIPEKYRALDTQALRDARRNWKAELAPDTVQDEFAIASILLDMEAYLAGGPSPYALEEAIADAWFWLLLQQAVQNPWKAISSKIADFSKKSQFP